MHCFEQRVCGGSRVRAESDVKAPDLSESAAVLHRSAQWRSFIARGMP